MRYNVDTKKQSYRPEIINLHYDRLHSPDNCYHFRIDWMNVTSKFIEDAISNWALHGRKYGLKLVEVPIAEASSITETHSFRAPYRIELIVPPPADGLPQTFDTTSFTAQIAPDLHAVHKALLKKLNFVLDVEAASSFPPDVEVVHSWGRNDYRHTQYIHHSGTTIAQITDDGAFSMLANRLYNDRLHMRESTRFETHLSSHNTYSTRTAARALGTNSPPSSPLVRPADLTAEAERGARSVTAKEIFREVERFCRDERALKAFYDDFRRPQPTPSPHLGPPPGLSAVLEGPVPSLRLPPRVVGREQGREGSASPVAVGRRGAEDGK